MIIVVVVIYIMAFFFLSKTELINLRFSSRRELKFDHHLLNDTPDYM